MEQEIRNEEVIGEQLTIQDMGVELETPVVESSIEIPIEVNNAVVEENQVVEELPIENQEVENSTDESSQNDELVIATVIPSNLNVRNQPSKDGEIITILNKDDEIRIIEDLGDFCKIFYNGLEGYCMKEFISIK